MAESKQQNEMSQDQISNLKYLDFVQVATVHAIVYFSSVYDYAKKNSGPLKPGVKTVEGTVKTVIGPVYEKFHDIPFEILKFADGKVDGLVHEVDRHVPALVKDASSQAYSAANKAPELARSMACEVQRVGSHVPALVKEASSQAYSVANKAPELARSMACEVQRVGVVDRASEMARATYSRLQPTAKDLYVRYEPVAERYAVSAWRSLNRLPLFPEVAHVVVPTAAYCSEKYNQSVQYMAEKGYVVSAYLPLVPTKRIAEVFAEEPAAFNTDRPVSSEAVTAAG